MTDPTGTNAQHPALVTATGPAAAPGSAVDATGTDAQHPALVTRLALEPAPPAASPPRHAAAHPHRPKRRRHRRRAPKTAHGHKPST
jgi:hypothetical protein